MKNRASHFQLADVFCTVQVHDRESDDLVVLVRLGCEFEKREGTPENILRWEDDGGPVFEAAIPFSPNRRRATLPGRWMRSGSDYCRMNTRANCQQKEKPHAYLDHRNPAHSVAAGLFWPECVLWFSEEWQRRSRLACDRVDPHRSEAAGNHLDPRRFNRRTGRGSQPAAPQYSLQEGRILHAVHHPDRCTGPGCDWRLAIGPTTLASRLSRRSV